MIHSASSSSSVLWMIVAIYAYTAHCLYTTKTSTIWSSTQNNHNNLYKRRYGGDSGGGGGSASSLSYIREGRGGGEGQLPLRQKTIVSTSRLYGIPKLFRWLIDLYPLVLESVGEGLSNNAMSVDYFYLDMNGIIHTCTHSNNDKLIPLREQEMFLRIFAYTDQLYKLVAPKKMMFLAVDGVAPRAKMNQQRSRRFRSSKEREILIAEHVAREGKMPDTESFDSNCITPGTEFMFRLGIAFRRWIAYKMKTDPFWQQGAEVVFSGPDVPGEGEHKVMDMIRSERESDSTYFPGKFRHCMYGLDADLIMLSLVTHEPYFVLLREKISRRKQNKDSMTYSKEDFECLEVSTLRQMLKQHFRKLNQDITKLTSSSQLPPLSTSILTSSPSSSSSQSSPEASAPIISMVPPVEALSSSSSSPSPSSSSSSSQSSPPVQQQQWTSEFDLDRVIDDFVFMCFFVGNDFLPCVPHLDIADGSLNLMMNTYRDMLPSLGGYLTRRDSIQLPRVELFIQEIARREPLYFQQRAIDEKDPGYSAAGYRDHYYKIKFGITPGDEDSIRKVVQAYVEGLYWVLTYYHLGCGSWTWYYPYLYAPLASDMVNLAAFDIEFPQGRPFTPLLQLLSVLPPQSGSFLPPSYEMVMSDPQSPLVEYYPKDFVVDANGKKNSWECVVCIPFIKEDVLVGTINDIDHLATLTETERIRNVPGQQHHFKPKIDPAAKSLKSPSKGTSDARWGNALVDARRRNNTPTTSGGGGGTRRPAYKASNNSNNNYQGNSSRDAIGRRKYDSPM